MGSHNAINRRMLQGAFVMYWTFEHNGQSYASWGSPRKQPYLSQAKNVKERYDIDIYSGAPIKSNESVCWLMQGDSTLGLGDSI